ncbi:MAG: GYD domain-containing protein [Proteobacteria bacterium]|nr:GYD domain-containing protein [Pseudomonadota bacterium]
MAKYIMLSNLTDEGRKTLKERPERLHEVNKEVESMGARVMGQYATMGGYDFVNIIEAPTNEVMAKLTVELGSRGTIKITTLPAMGVDEFVEMLGGKAPGGG